MCGIRKPLSDFNLKSGEKFVYESNCKDCERKKSLDNLSYIKTKKEIIDTQKRWINHFHQKKY